MQPVVSIKNKLAQALSMAGVSANTLTGLGLLLAFFSAWLIAIGQLWTAGGVLLISGLFDALDGAVARHTKKDTPFGGILDSSLDRYGDGAVYCGVIWLALSSGHKVTATLAMSALIGSFSISYVRARVECETENCRVGFWERGERLVFLVVALLLNNLNTAMGVLGIATHWTVFQRLSFAHIQTSNASSKKIPWYLQSSSRSSAAYFFKVAFLVFALVFLPH